MIHFFLRNSWIYPDAYAYASYVGVNERIVIAKVIHYFTLRGQ